jgi:hypothetical protein
MTHDDRAEQAFRDAFSSRADSFEPEVLSDEPVRRPRRTWPVVLLAAAAVLVLAVGTLVWRSAGSDDRTSTAAAALPDGWRWESYRDVMVAVPDSWGYAYAPGDQWCTQYDSDGTPQNPRTPSLPAQGYVDMSLPGAASTAVLCGAGDVPPEPLFVVHLSFLAEEGPAPVPEGWSNVTRAVGSIRVDVVADSEHQTLADRILATAHVATTDQNGCDTTSRIQARQPVRPDPPVDLSALTTVDSIAVCQYDLAPDGPGLVASELLTGTRATSELSALQAAPSGSGPDRAGAGCESGTQWDPGDDGLVLRLTSGGASHDVYVYYSDCHDNGVDDGTQVRELTAQNCSPLWGGRLTDMGGIGAVFNRCVPETS